MRGCCVPMCKSNKKRDKISFHEMPSSEELREKWVEAIMENAPPKESEWFPDQYDLVCAKHFTADDYRPTCTVRCLKAGAVPSVFVDSLEYEQTRSPSNHFETEVLECNLEEINCHLRKSGSSDENSSGPSAFKPRSKNLKRIKKGQNCSEKSLFKTKTVRGSRKKQITSLGDLSTEAFTSQTPMVTHLSRMSSSRIATDDSVSSSDTTNTLVHESPKLKSGISLISNEVIYNRQQILQKEISDCVIASDMSSFKTKSSYMNFLMKELESAQEEISELQAYITRLQEQNVKLQWEKNSLLVTHLHDIKQDAVDGNYDAIILLNRIVHYSLERT